MSLSEGEKVEIVLSSSILALAVYTGQGPGTVHVYTHQEYLHDVVLGCMQDSAVLHHNLLHSSCFI